VVSQTTMVIVGKSLCNVTLVINVTSNQYCSGLTLNYVIYGLIWTEVRSFLHPIVHQNLSGDF